MQYLSQQITSFLDTNLVDIYNEWSASTTYSFEEGTPTNASVVRYGTHYYRSVIGSNINNNPVETENVKWTKYGVSNKFAMLDLASGTKSTFVGGSLFVTFDRNYITTLTIGNYDAETITVEVLNSSSVVLWTYTTDSVINEEVEDYWTYIYSEYGDTVNRGIKIDLQSVGTRVRVIFNNFGETANTSCGYLVGGVAIDMGKTLNGVGFKFNSFATKETDEWGSLLITKRAVQDLVDFETLIDTNRIQSYKRKLKEIYNSIIVFIVDESSDSKYENILTLGTIQDASVLLTDFDKTVMTYSVMESI